MNKLETLFISRDMMNKYRYPVEMIIGITNKIDKIINDG